LNSIEVRQASRFPAMSTASDPLPPARRNPEARYLASRPASGSTHSYFCKGDTLEEMRLRLQRAQEPGHYRVFDRRPAARGIDAELIGVFLVDDGGTIQWKPLRSL
jgi:hypothetical protein